MACVSIVSIGFNGSNYYNSEDLGGLYQTNKPISINYGIVKDQAPLPKPRLIRGRSDAKIWVVSSLSQGLQTCARLARLEVTRK